MLRKKEDLLCKKDRVLTRGSLDDLNRRKQQLKMLTKKLVRLAKRIGDLDNEIDQLQEDDMKISSVLERAIVNVIWITTNTK